MRNNLFIKIIITTLLVTFLTFTVGRVTRVSAVGTVATVAGAALLATGVVYMSYLALTGAQMRIPVADDIELWLKDIGTKVVQYPSGSATYRELYDYYSLQDPIANVIDGVWSWTEDKLKSFANDFSNIRIIDDLVQYGLALDPVPPAVDYSYEIDFQPLILATYSSGTFVPLPASVTLYTGARVLYYDSSLGYTIVNTDITVPVRNYHIGNVYKPQQYVNGSWIDVSSVNIVARGYNVVVRDNTFCLIRNSYSYNLTAHSTSLPLFADADIVEAVTGEVVASIPRESTEIIHPSWNDPDNDNRPVVPWIPIPDLPASIDVPSGYSGVDQWGFNLEDLLDNLADLGESIFDLAVLKELINSFAGLHGDQYYLYYDNGDINYYTFYQPTIYEGDYIIYNYDISEQEEVMPVNLNEIQLYTDNRYLEQIKHSAVAGSSMLRDLAVFWYDVDPEITYIVLGCCLLVLIGAFTGKLGHS